MKTLMPFQREGSNFILTSWVDPQPESTCLLADDMGLGKTVQAIEACRMLSWNWDVGQANDSIMHAVVVCPKSLKINWQKEIETWCSTHDRIAWFIYSYEDIRKINVDEFKAHVLIADECHYLKNETTQRFRRFWKLAVKAERLLLLSGTPIENRHRELLPLLWLLDSEQWGSPRDTEKKHEYEKRFCGGHLQHIYAIKSTCVRNRPPGRDCSGCKWMVSASTNGILLAERLSSMRILRRTKEQVLPELPPKRRVLTIMQKDESFKRLGLEPNLQDLFIYPEFYEQDVKKLEENQALFEQISSRRKLEGLNKAPSVAEYAAELLETIPKIGIFTYHREVAHAIHAKLVECGYDFSKTVCVDGSFEVEERQKAVDLFQNDPQVRIFIGTIRSCGVGFTLTAAHHALFAEFDWSPKVLEQAEDRFHRIGQRDSVLIEHCAQHDTLDARILKVLLKKQEIIEKVENNLNGSTSAIV